MPLLLALAALAGVAGQPARAGAFAWDTTMIQVDAKPGQQVVNVTYRFRNAGKSPVRIISVETSCRCTAADSDRTTYGPGEKGRINVEFTLGGQDGLQEKDITVSTDEPGAKPVNLDLRVRIPAHR